MKKSQSKKEGHRLALTIAHTSICLHSDSVNCSIPMRDNLLTYRHRWLCEGLVLALFGMTMLSCNFVDAICDKKNRGKDKKCSSYSNCDDCIACDPYCSWCHTNGMCSKFCEGQDGSACHSGDCARKSEFKCVTIAESHSSGVDYKMGGGIDLEMQGVMSSAEGPGNRGVDKGAKVRRSTEMAKPRSQ